MAVALLIFAFYSISPFKPLTLFSGMETPGHHKKKKKVRNHTDLFQQTSKNNKKHLIFPAFSNSEFYIQSYPHKFTNHTTSITVSLPNFPCVVHTHFHTSQAPATASHA